MVKRFALWFFFSLCLLRPVLSIYLFVKKPLNPNAHDTGAGWGGDIQFHGPLHQVSYES